MSLITNYPELASTDSRKILLNVIDAGLSAIQPEAVIAKNFTLQDETLNVQDKTYDLKNYDSIFLIAFGKGSAQIAGLIEKTLGPKLAKGFAIDVTDAHFEKVEYGEGTHPLPSLQNLDFTAKVIDSLKDLTARDMVLVVICGGGSVMFESPFSVDAAKLIEVNKALLASGADIIEMNTIRKHLSKTKGGGLVNILRPAKIVSLIFSDVPGNDLSFIASGPTVLDKTTKEDAMAVYSKYSLQNLNLTADDFCETPKEEEIFGSVDNVLILSNLTALNAMKQEAEKWGIKAEIYSDKFQSDAATAGAALIANTPENSMLLVGGETTVKVKNKDGQGGRNHHLVLSALKLLGAKTSIASVASDGWDNTPSAGAIGDAETVRKANEKNLDQAKFMEESNSYQFFNTCGDGIITNRLPSNVADLIIVYKY